MNDVDLRSEFRAYQRGVVSSIDDDDMRTMIGDIASRESGLLRPQLVIKSAEVFGVPLKHIMPVASGIEWVHAATLILDDTTFMDDSDVRNGKISFHKKYGPAKTILVAQYLSSALAPRLNMSNGYLSEEQRNRVQSESARAAEGLCFGQNVDLYHRPETLEDVVKLHRKKTGDLFAAAAVIGGISGMANIFEIDTLRSFGYHLGIAYQMGDDLFDALGDASKGGKPVGQDKDKVTVLDFKSESDAIKFWQDFYHKSEMDLLQLSTSLRARERLGNFEGKADAQPLHDVLKLVRDKQEGLLENVLS